MLEVKYFETCRCWLLKNGEYMLRAVGETLEEAKTRLIEYLEFNIEMYLLDHRGIYTPAPKFEKALKRLEKIIRKDAYMRMIGVMK